MSTRRALLLATALILAGCGLRPGPVARQAQGGALAVRSRDAGAELIAGLRGMAAQLNTFSAVVSFWERTDGEAQTSTAEVYTARPQKIRANITEASQALKRGVKVLYLGDQQVTIKQGFLKHTFDYNDSKVTSLHAWRIDQTDLNALITGLTDPAGQATALGPVTVNGVAGQAVEVVSPAMLPGVTKEIVVLDPATFVPLRFEAFVGAEPVYRLEIAKARINPTLPSDIFSL